MAYVEKTINQDTPQSTYTDTTAISLTVAQIEAILDVLEPDFSDPAYYAIGYDDSTNTFYVRVVKV